MPEPSPIAMPPDSYDFLKALVDAPTTSGYEERAQAVFRAYVERFGVAHRTDLHGNVIASLNPGARPRVMLAGHADEIGFQIRYIDDDGCLWFAGVGGHDPFITIGQRVTVHTSRHGDLPGVIGKKAIHLLDEKEREKKPELDELWIDIGARGREEAEELVSIGDFATYAPELVRLQNRFAVASGFDNKIGVWVVAEAMRLLAERGDGLRCAVYGVSTVQEEIGLRGAHTAAFGIEAEVGVAIDVGHASDYPTVDKRRLGDIRLGRGPKVTRGANINPKVFALLTRAAEEEGIPCQLIAAPRGTGTDANAMQLSRAGMATGLLSVPLRYMHTPCEMLDLDDLNHTARLLAAFIARVTPETDFTP